MIHAANRVIAGAVNGCTFKRSSGKFIRCQSNVWSMTGSAC